MYLLLVLYEIDFTSAEKKFTALLTSTDEHKKTSGDNLSLMPAAVGKNLKPTKDEVKAFTVLFQRWME